MSQLKVIAMIIMLIDHFAYVMLERGTGLGGNFYILDRVMRSVGRIAFPIFCFTIVEGFQKTKDVRAYMKRLIIFALISEIPFDLAFRGVLIDRSYQNVFWTLAFGLMTLILYEHRWLPTWKRVLGFLVCFFVPQMIHTDYSVYGVLAIFAMYYFRNEPVKSCMAGYIVLLLQSTSEMWAFVGFLLILMYNGQKGKGNKFFCYWFYPVHLLLLIVLKPYIVSFLSSFMAVTVFV